MALNQKLAKDGDVLKQVLFYQVINIMHKNIVSKFCGMRSDLK